MFSLQAVFIKVTAGFPPRHTHSSNVTGSCESLSREGFMGGSASQVRSLPGPTLCSGELSSLFR